jgi:predicted O-methyltransferase YrrM
MYKLRHRARQFADVSRSFFGLRDIAADATASQVLAQEISSLKYPTEFYSFVYDQMKSLRRTVVTVREGQSDTRLAKFIASIASSENPTQLPAVIEIGRYADSVRSDLRELGDSDVSEHFYISSSLTTKGRFLSNLVRYCRVTSCIEIGTAYGISSMFMLASQQQCGIRPNVTTIEGFSPQKEISSAKLKDKYGDSVTTLHGLKEDIIISLLDNGPQFDMLFHDGSHRGDDYIEDFKKVRKILKPNSIVVIDDIRWGAPSKASKLTCHEGWLEVVKEPGVRHAVEVDGSIGVLLLS